MKEKPGIQLDSLTPRMASLVNVLAKQLEMEAVDSENYEDAARWRDISKNGTTVVVERDHDGMFKFEAELINQYKQF
jgi:hypothetical protein